VEAAAEDVALDIDALRGQVLMRTGRWSEADVLLHDVAARASARRDPYHEAVALLNLGMGRVVRGRYDEALPFFERVVDRKEIDGYTVHANALTNAGLSYARLGQFDRAIEVQRRAVASHEKRGVPVYLEQSLGELGNSYFLAGNPGQALTYLTRAFAVATSAGLADDAALWAGNVAATAVQLGQFERAEELNSQAIALKAKTGGNTIYNGLNAAHIAAGRGQARIAAALYEQILETARTDPAVQWEAHAGLARIALATGDTPGAMRHFDAALERVEQTRADLLKAEYRLTFLTRVIRFYQDYVDTLVSTGHAARALEVADSSRAVVLAERMGRGALPRSRTAGHLVAAAGRAQSIWLSYWLGRERSYAWVVTPAGIKTATLPGAPEIERLVTGHDALVQSGADPLTTAHTPGDTLYSTVIGPIARFIPRGSNVRIVPDGALHSVNFETLPVDDPGKRHYWIEDVTLAVSPSLALLAANAGTTVQAADRSLLLVGDPTPRPPEYPRLGYAPIEMAAVSRHFAPARTVRVDGDRASPATYFAAGPDKFSVIHFAAHAAANRTSPLDSAVILSGPPGADKLYARDVADKPLSARLVTISACRSAGERTYAGEGLIGFAWAFMRAGARQVIAGLWDVDDQSTAALMENLYAGIARGEPAPDALRDAKLSMLRSGGNIARPYYWGPFEVFTVQP
jgi:CHAT domain-containing protein/tetratricopeptide (TPR) repeat protein